MTPAMADGVGKLWDTPDMMMALEDREAARQDR
jgi:hypothetical protein